jgi:uncharacterized protein YsxB (DUF464 family)
LIDIKIIESNGLIEEISVSGHSGAGKKGNDVVCSAVSAVIWTLIHGSLKYYNEQCEIEQSENNISLKAIETASKEFRAVLQVTENGLNEIASRNNGFIKLEKILKNTGGASYGT